MPGINIYYAPEDEKRILGVLSNYLPFEQHEMDIVDRLVSKIRF
jgi:RNA binding exosome subunit